MAKSRRTKRIEQMQKEYKKLATQANRRMTMLERLSRNPDYSAVLGYAYKNAAYNLKALGAEKGRFPQDIAKRSAKETDIRNLQAYIATAKEFLESPTSLKSGIDKVYGARARTINKKFGTSLTPDDMKTFFESQYWEKTKNRFGSQMAMIIIGKIQKKSGEILRDINDAKKKHHRIQIEALKDVDGLNVDAMLSRSDRNVVKNLAAIYSQKENDTK